MNFKRGVLSCAVACLTGLSYEGHAAGVDLVTIDDNAVFPESITSTAAGDLIIGSMAKGAVYRAKSGATQATLWLDPAVTGLVSVLGVLADDRSNSLYVCSISPRKGPRRPELSALLTFDLQTGAPKSRYAMPNPESAICNDIAVDQSGVAYITDTGRGRILRLQPGAATLEVWVEDSRFAGADGVALGKSSVFVNTVTTNRLFSVAIQADRAAGPIVELHPSLPLSGPDGMRGLGGDRFLLAENAAGVGRISEVTVTADQAVLKVLKVDPGVTAMTVVGTSVWVNNAKFAYGPGGALQGQSPEPFTEYAIPLVAIAQAATPADKSADVPNGSPPGVTPLRPSTSLDLSSFPMPLQVPGQPIESRPPELSTDQPAFRGQTRAPYKPTVPYRVTLVTDQLKAPWSLAFLPDGKLLVTERSGKMLVVDANGALSSAVTGVPAVDYRGQVGLLDVAIDPQFSANHRVFFSFMEPVDEENSGIAVARAVLDVAAGALSDVKVIFRAKPALPKALMYNAGSRIAIGTDGNLFVTVGDRSKMPPWDMAQRLDTHLGKIIRITPEGAPAPGNPFLHTPGALAEIWSIGHRSQEGLAFDSKGRLWESEHGPRGGDELNTPQAGKNYGWPLITHGVDYPGEVINGGLTAKAGLEQPRYYWDPVIAPSGLAFYRGSLFPQWQGSVFVGALRGRMLDRLTIERGRVLDEEPLLLDLRARIRDVRVGPEGAVYVLTDDSRLLKLTPK